MLAYLTRITNASKMAEKKLEMKAERGNLIYPKQIKRELGAKIIYDAICRLPVKHFMDLIHMKKKLMAAWEQKI